MFNLEVLKFILRLILCLININNLNLFQNLSHLCSILDLYLIYSHSPYLIWILRHSHIYFTVPNDGNATKFQEIKNDGEV